ncbi:DUF2165 family protein [Devosia aquimaris]|uniref:DUF2165 family protein n=1 Tax=Devosia aquimaris TaxID=2866214 RepID=UPI001CD076A6|nr:DUF2165 family protein [Devosia sp. CJK-A8-3]
MTQLLVWIQLFMVLMPTLWLVLGALENIRAPAANGNMVADVLAMRLMRDQFPELYAVLGRNRIESQRLHRLLFAAIVTAETIVALVMVAGTLALLLAALGLVGLEPARVLAAIGMLGFCMIWSAFLVGGQWVHYWAGAEGAQHTHLKLTLWGALVLVLLYIG